MIKRLLSILIILVACLSCSREQNYYSKEDEQLDIVNDGSFINESIKNVGIYLDSPDDFRSLQIQPQFICWFDNWYDSMSINKLLLCGQDRLALPFITWQPSNIDFNEILQGKHDDYIVDYFTQLTSSCPDNDILIRFAHEMEMRPFYPESWYSWQGMKKQLYIDTWHYLVDKARSINKRIKWVWSPNRADMYSKKYYPGDDYVDYVGVTANLSLEYINRYSTFKNYYSRWLGRNNLLKYNKKIVISEVAYSDCDKKADYLKSIFDYYCTDDRIVLVAFFNYDVSENKQYMIYDDKIYMDVFYDGLREMESLN